MLDAMEFLKLSGSGNDFVCIDNRDGRYDRILEDGDRAARFAREICHRGTGIGADGLVFAVEPEVSVADVAAVFFEPDGSRAELCGNGTGCFVRWVLDHRWAPGPEIKVLTDAGVVIGKAMDGRYIRVCIPLPEHIERNVTVDLDGSPVLCDVAVTGVPHAVVYVEDIDRVDVAHLGPLLRHHPRFAPRGINANFVQVLDTGRLALRTYEFGVEGETLACGTGAAAAAVLAILRFGWGGDLRRAGQAVSVHTRGGDVLRVFCEFQEDDAVSDLCVDTIVRPVFHGTADPALIQRALGHES